jgi:peptide-methionine (S)-S-oxide reductase
LGYTCCSIILVCLTALSGQAESLNKVIPAPKADIKQSGSQEKAVLAGGCFWGVQAAFQHVKGVTKVVAGYSGGEKNTATYDQVSTETTGHAESVEITYNPQEVTFGTLLRIYFSVVHDPTQLNRQGPDTGNSYRSEIFAANSDQERVAKAYIEQLSQPKLFGNSPIVTRIQLLKGFYPAEDYHQDYATKHPHQPYIVINDLPKIEALKKTYPDLYR